MSYFRECETDVSISKHLITLLYDIQFFAEISRNVRKTPTRDIETACILYDLDAEEVQLWWNPDFFSLLTPKEIIFVVVHEFHHLIDGHITVRSKNFEDHETANIAQDLAINSIIVDYKNMEAPKCVLLPGKDVVWPGVDSKFSTLIESFPPKKASEFYYEKLKAKMPPMVGKSPQPAPQSGTGVGSPGKGTGNSDKTNPGGSEPGAAEGEGEGDASSPGSGKGKPDKNGKPTPGGTLDDHSPWKKIDVDVKERIDAKIDSIIEKAVNHADGTSNGWGNMPADTVAAIRKRISRQVDWKRVLRQFVGTLLVGGRKSSRRHINRKQPYDYPGVKRGRTVKLLVAVDESGSVDDKMLELFFAEMYSLNRLVEINMLPFDYEADVKRVVPMRKGSNVVLKRVKRGGTCFDAPTQVFDDPKNRGRWDGLLIVTDGQAPAPKPCRKRRAWVVPEGCKLYFATEETTIVIKKETK